jgi:hypothetical protein
MKGDGRHRLREWPAEEDLVSRKRQVRARKSYLYSLEGLDRATIPTHSDTLPCKSKESTPRNKSIA